MKLVGKAAGTKYKLQKMVYSVLDSVNFDNGHERTPTIPTIWSKPL